MVAWRGAAHTVSVLRSTGPMWADRNCTANTAVVTGLVCVVVIATASSDQPIWLLFAAATVYFSLVDIDTHSVPVFHARLAVVISFMMLTATAQLTGASPREMVAAAAASWLSMKMIEIVSRGGLGAGDVTLAPLIGVHAGWSDWTGAARALALAFVMAGVIAVVIATVRRGGRRTHLPLAPFLFAGAWVVVLR